ncbi:hypothetical protein [Mycoplasmoides pirum]|uniref:hypothetical protein n=1 Tax=Mycoplasmoides pirum TaxID=2122 RepID=UPI0004839E24|nr:hypothetical protein [Mycoplasmoides pirum]
MKNKKTRQYKSTDACAYPYLYETSMKVDYELITDEIACYIGYLTSFVKEKKLHRDLIWLTELAWHINGSIRGKNIIDKKIYEKILNLYKFYKTKIKSNLKQFVLPIGNSSSCIAEIIRCLFKKAVRTTHKLSINESNLKISDLIFDSLNLLSNLFNYIAIYLREKNQDQVVTFKSKSY